MKLRFIALLDLPYARTLGLDRLGDLFPMRYQEAYREKVRAEINKIRMKNQERTDQGKTPIELDVTVNIHYAKRSLDFNAWMWAVHTLEANILNGKRSAWTDEARLRWREAGTITPEMIHEADMAQYAPIATVDVDETNAAFISKVLEEESGRVIGHDVLPSGKIRITIRQTSSYWDVRRAAEYGDILRDRLLSYGINIDNAVEYKQLAEDFISWHQSIEDG